jgi:dTDP-4-dehydrorhamnose reductase
MAERVILMEATIVLGGEGTVGSAFNKYIRLDRKQCNITDICSIQEMVNYYNPTTIINCAGIVGTQKCEDDKEHAYLTNLGGVVNLVHICNKLNIKLIQISTAYASEDNAYCNSKLMAEEVIMKTSKSYLIVALPWVFNIGDDSFISNSLNNIVSLYDDEIGFLAYAPDVVKFIEDRKDMVGYISIANKGALKRKDALLELGNIQDKIILFRTKERSITMSGIKNAPLYFMRPWQEAIKEYADGLRAMQSTS